ncbi:uncharacterized protein LOC135831176 [Planococcus citri]|uniref:uncharacterized protein LOC135831176 n=1 Tax=Planococcus citri TaxID=170843 RepID=UPI0031F8C1C6
MENTREVVGTSDDGTISYVIVTEDLSENVTRILEEGFYPFECVSIASNVSKNPKAVAELNTLTTECIKEGVSVAAIDNQTNKVIGVSVNKIQVNDPNQEETFFDKFTRENCKEKESAALMNTMVYCDSSINLFQHLKVNKIMELIFICVTPSHRKRGVGVDLVKFDLKLLDKLSQDEDGPKAASALLTSTYSQRIGEKLDFEILLTISYNTFMYDGVKFSNKIDKQHKGIKLAVKKCTAKDDEFVEVCPRI